MSKAQKINAKSIDVSAKSRKHMELALHPRTEVLARRFSPDDIKKWKARAEAAKMNMTDWMKLKLDA
ncbi:MAG TPA: hypothetical protein VI259_12765 [Gemmatimonadaceae bacterium]